MAAMPVAWLSVWLLLYATGLHRLPVGWVWAALLYFFPTVALVAALARHPRSGPGDLTLLGAFGVLVALSLGALSGWTVPINHTRLDAELDSLDPLPAAEVVSWQESGGPFCVTRCPRVANLYLVKGDATGVATVLHDWLQRRGYEVGSDADHLPPSWYAGVAEAFVGGHHGDISIDCWIYPLGRRETTGVDPSSSGSAGGSAGELSVLAECAATRYVPDI